MKTRSETKSPFVDFPRSEGIYWHRSLLWDIPWHKVEVVPGIFGLVVNLGEGRGYVPVASTLGDDWKGEE